MLFILLCITGLLATATADASEIGKPFYDVEKAEVLFHEFMKSYGKSYPNDDEKQKRLEIFKQNLRSINEKNSANGAVFDINKFSDLSPKEFGRSLGFRPNQNFSDPSCKVINDMTTKDAPNELDWRTKGAVTPIKNQGRCGSCWAFATVANIEGQVAIKTSKLQSFSEQELVDCCTSNGGCDGAQNLEVALTDLITIGGVELESDYPYKAKNGKCQFDRTKSKVQLKSCLSYHLKDEEKLKEALFKQGPLIIGVNGEAVMQYTHGILTLEQCPAEGIDHAVTLVGYGSENGNDFWIIKNSWAESFGEKGYFRMHRGDNTCGIMIIPITSSVI